MPENTKDYESELFGTIKLGIIESIDKETYIATVRMADGLGQPNNVVATPSAHLGFLPEAGTIAVVYDKPGWEKHVIGYLSIPNDRTFEEVAASGENDATNVPFKSMKGGDMYVGKYGRAYFNSSGDVGINTFHNRATIKLDEKESTAKISGYNFEMTTPGKGISIFTSSSIPGIYGDSLSIQRNVPSPASSIPKEFNPVPNIKVSEITLDTAGDFIIDVGINGTTPSSYFSMDIIGDITMGNVQKASLSIYADTEVDLHNPLAGLKLGIAGDSTLSTTTAEVYVDTLGMTRLSSLSAPGTLPVASLALDGITGNATLFSNLTTSITSVVSNVITAPTVAGPITMGGGAGAGTMNSLTATTLNTPGFAIVSPSTSFSGNTTIAGNTTIQGNTLVSGNTTLVGNVNVYGAFNLLGLPSFSGLMSPTPFIALAEIAFIPVVVMVGGVPMVGRIPVHA
jgi:hypothetical protein